MHFCVVHQATRSGIENRVANRACRAIQPSISSSIQPTERAPSDTWRGNSPFAIRTCVRTSTWLAAGGPIEPTGATVLRTGQGIDLETTQSMQGYFGQLLRIGPGWEVSRAPKSPKRVRQFPSRCTACANSCPLPVRPRARDGRKRTKRHEDSGKIHTYGNVWNLRNLLK